MANRKTLGRWLRLAVWQAVLMLSQNCPTALSAPGIIKAPVKLTHHGDNWRVVLAPAVAKSISTHFPGYSLPHLQWFDASLNVTPNPPKNEEGPFACVGDFDGNGLPDAAVVLHRRRQRWLLIAFNQTSPGVFRPHVLLRFTERENRLSGSILDHRYTFTLECMSKAQAREEARVRPVGDTLVFGGPESFTLFYYRRGRFHGVDDTAE